MPVTQRRQQQNSQRIAQLSQRGRQPDGLRRSADILAQQALLRHPDFVVARMKGQYWQVREKVFDYEGRFRRAHELRG